MTCPEGFDPFVDRDAAFLAHVEGCEGCADVLRVLDLGAVAWKAARTKDEARGFFRARRLSQATAPVRRAMAPIVALVILAGLSGYALARHAEPSRAEAPAPVVVARHGLIEAPEQAHRAVSRVAIPPPEPEPAPTTVEPEREREAVNEPPAIPPPPDGLELWKHANALLDAGDRAGSEAAFRRVIDAGPASLRSRATFRWAELVLSRGDTSAPREPLFRLVRGGDAALGFEAALLLERCAPAERSAIWDAYLARTADPDLRARALERRNPAHAE